MAILDIFSKRTLRASKTEADVYTYDLMPQELRVQCIHILRDMIGPWREYGGESNDIYITVNKALCKEYGVFTLTKSHHLPDESLWTFLLEASEAGKALDVVELMFTAGTSVWSHYPCPIQSNPEEAIAEFNARCREHSFGYQIESGKIIRMDSTFTHKEMIKPALNLLSDSAFSGANQEFLKAHEHYRHKRYKECISECLKALESTIKTIGSIRKWQLQANATASKLIEACFSNGLVDPLLSSHIGALRTTLESGVPTIRNKTSGHGQGVTPVTVPDYYARYVLNQTAACILFLIEAHHSAK